MTVVGSPSIAERIENAFRAASSTTGTSFEYLLTTASRESSLRPAVSAPNSSALGLFQFIESTWLETMKQAGPEHGLGRYADQITRTAGGRYTVADPAMRQTILNLRSDPDTAAIMAGALTQRNAEILTGKLGRQPTNGELYMAHFLGATGASRLIALAANDPSKPAAEVFRTQARANRTIFYGSDGAALSSRQVYLNLTASHGATHGTATAGLVPPKPPVRPATAPPTDFAALPAAVTASHFPVPASDEASRRVAEAWRAANPSAAFHSLFRNDPSAPISPLAPALWSAFAAENNGLLFASSTPSRTDNLFTSTASLPSAAVLPADFTRYLSIPKSGTPEDLLPPA